MIEFFLSIPKIYFNFQLFAFTLFIFLYKKLGETVGQSNESTPATASSSPTVHPAAGK